MPLEVNELGSGHHQRIGFVGAGRMGAPMVDRLLSLGREVWVYARRPEVRRRLSAAGATVTDSPGHLAAVDVLVCCLYSDAQLFEVLPPILSALHPGAVLVSHTTGTPETLLRLAAADTHVGVVDAPFSGTDTDVHEGRLTVYLGGETEAITHACDVVSGYADPVIRTGPLGSALRFKLINNLLFGGISQLTLQALQAGAVLGLDETALLSALGHGSGGSTAAGHIAAIGGAEVFCTYVAPFLRKDVAACEDAVRAAGGDVSAVLGSLLAAVRTGPIDVGPSRKERSVTHQ